MILGIDPSQRHTGLCLLQGAEPLFYEIKTGDMNLLDSTRRIRFELDTFLRRDLRHEYITTYVVEKQLSVGARASSLMFHIQMVVMDVIWRYQEKKDPPALLMMPLPGQLFSYIRTVQGYKGTNTPGQLVQHYKKQTNRAGRISEHLVDAYYLALLGKDVNEKKWRYTLPTREQNLTPWKVTNGDD